MNSIAQRLNDLRKSEANSEIVYKPVFYRLHRAEDRSHFERILERPALRINDHIRDQLSEFVKIQKPYRKFTAEELQQEVDKHLGSTPIDEYGVWVFYPWSNRVVHILDEREFIAVRTSRNQYKITPEEREILATKKIGVVGLSVGQSVSVTLAMERICGELRLADFDKLELTNLNRIRTGIHNLGLEKVYSVAREISEIDPFLTVRCFNQGLTEENMNDFFTKDGKLDLLVEESDGFDIKILCRYKARELQVPVIMEASDRCMVDVERFDLEPHRSILHGIVDHLDIPTLKSLKTNEEKIPYMLDVLGIDTTTPRLKASMIEMQQTITTWPQLASAVTMGGGITADVSRRMLLNQFTQSGRYYVDIDELIGNKQTHETNGTEATTSSNKSALTFADMKHLAQKAVTGNSTLKEADAQKIVDAALAAPSQGNKQPWKWYFTEGRLFLFWDQQGDVLFVDPEYVQTFLSLGASLANASVVAADLGYQIHLDFFPNGSKNNLVAACRFDTAEKAEATRSLAPYIFERYTNRKAGNGEPIASFVFDEMTSMCGDHAGVSFNYTTNREDISRIGSMVGLCERIQLLDPRGHQQYFNQILRWPKTNDIIREGIDIRTLALPTAVETALHVISHPPVAKLLNDWEKGIAFEKLQQQLTATSSAIGMVSVLPSSTNSYLDAGMALEKMWLVATKNNLAFHPICLPLVFLKHLRAGGTESFFSEKINSQLNAIKNQLSLIFSEMSTNKEAVFLFRLSHAPLQDARSMRKQVENVYFKS